MDDRLASLLERFALAAHVFYSGELCGTAAFDDADGMGHLHLLREGEASLELAAAEPVFLRAPALVFFSRPVPHRLRADNTAKTDVVCASIELGAGGDNPVASSLPAMIQLDLGDAPALRVLAELLFQEAFAARCGRQAALDRIAELLVIELLRHALDARLVRGGILAGLADPRLSRALGAMHAEPVLPWTLDSMAAQAGMSRARFAVHFRDVVGTTPGNYLAEWRLDSAMVLLRKGWAVKSVALEVGYASASALARAFTARRGVSPTRWRAQQRGAHTGSSA